MDRNGDWEKREKPTKFSPKAREILDSSSVYIKSQYAKDLDDDDVEAGRHINKEGRVRDNDAVIFFNFHEDSARQLTQSFRG